MKWYFHDYEVTSNMLMVAFVPYSIDNDLLEAYIKADMLGYKDDLKAISETMGIKVFKVCRGLINELPELMQFLKGSPTLIGYNSTNYDSLITDYLLKFGNQYDQNLYRYRTQSDFHVDIKALSDAIIDYGTGYDKIFHQMYRIDPKNRGFTNLDIQRILYLDKKYVSLKQVAIMLNWYKILDMPLHHTHWVKNYKELDMIEYYNINDTLITYKLWYHKIKEVNLRFNVTKQYGVDVRNESRSGMANKILVNYYADLSGQHPSEFFRQTTRHRISLNDAISNKVKFKTKELNALLTKIRNTVVIPGSDSNDDKFKIDLIYSNNAYTIAKGGIHSKDQPNIFISDNKFWYIDADVGSYYPRTIINERICPAHLDPDIFIKILEIFTDKRLSAKHTFKKLSNLIKTEKLSENDTTIINNILSISETEMEALKIVINAIFGKFGDQYSMINDLLALYATTINGQLLILMLIEDLALHGFQCVSANTDGIVVKVPVDRYDEYKTICDNWSKSNDYELEFTKYEKYICMNVNNYIAIKEGFSETKDPDLIKYKGLFSMEIEIDKGYSMPIVSKVLNDYYVYNKPIADSLKSYTNIFDFCISQKVGGQFENKIFSFEEDNLISEELQKNNRFYITYDNAGSMLKVHKDTGKKLSIIKKQNIRILNDYNAFTPFYDYKVNYQFYYNEIMKIVSKIDASKTKLDIWNF